MQKAILILNEGIKKSKQDLEATDTELDLLKDSIFMDDRIAELITRKKFCEETIAECKKCIKVIEAYAVKQKKETIPPLLEDVVEYMRKKRIIEPEKNAEKFCAHYNTNGWKVGKGGLPMKSWTSAITTWDLPKGAEATVEKKSNNPANRLSTNF